MSDLLSILDRLVQENLHGPIDPSMVSPSNSRQQPQHHRITEDMDARDPRWKRLFKEFFLADHSDDRNDDLLFFVQRADEAENGGLGVDPVFVKRKIKSQKKPLGHPQQEQHLQEKEQRLLTPAQEAVVLWKDTFFLNVIVQLQCKLTVAVCSRVSETDPQTGVVRTSMTCTRRHVSKRVYASPTKSRMDVKEESVECSWPLIYYVVDDFEDMFEQLMVRDNEYLCVELAVTLPTATSSTSVSGDGGGVPKISTSGLSRHVDPVSSPDGLRAGKPFPSASFMTSPNAPGSTKVSNKITLFQGAAGFQSLLGIYQQKAAPKIGKRSFKNLLGPLTVPTEFVMMRGPGGRGHAQVAITASNIGDDPALAYVEEGSSPTNLNSNGNGNGYSSPSSSEKKLPPIPGVPDQPSDLSHHTTTAGSPAVTASPAPPSKRRIEIFNPTSPAQQQHSAAPPSPPPKVSPSSVNSGAKTFSTGSFFQSLRRISLSTLAQAGVFGVSNTSTPESGPSTANNGNGGIINAASSSTTTTTAHHPIHVHVNTSSHSLGRPSSASSPPSSPISVSGQKKQLNVAQVSNTLPPSSVSSTAGSTTESISVGTRQEIEALVKQPQSLRCCMTFVNVPWTGIITLLMNHAYSIQLNAINSVAPPSTAP